MWFVKKLYEPFYDISRLVSAKRTFYSTSYSAFSIIEVYLLQRTFAQRACGVWRKLTKNLRRSSVKFLEQNSHCFVEIWTLGAAAVASHPCQNLRVPCSVQNLHCKVFPVSKVVQGAFLFFARHMQHVQMNSAQIDLGQTTADLVNTVVNSFTIFFEIVGNCPTLAMLQRVESSTRQSWRHFYERFDRLNNLHFPSEPSGMRIARKRDAISRLLSSRQQSWMVCTTWHMSFLRCVMFTAIHRVRTFFRSCNNTICCRVHARSIAHLSVFKH